MPRRMRALAAALSRRRRRARCSSARSCGRRAGVAGGAEGVRPEQSGCRMRSGACKAAGICLCDSNQHSRERMGAEHRCRGNRCRTPVGRRHSGAAPGPSGCQTRPPPAPPRNGRPRTRAQTRSAHAPPPRPCAHAAPGGRNGGRQQRRQQVQGRAVEVAAEGPSPPEILVLFIQVHPSLIEDWGPPRHPARCLTPLAVPPLNCIIMRGSKYTKL